MDIVIAKPRGFCAGVVRAVEIVEQALDLYGPPIYVLHQIVHNREVIRDLEARGVVFTEDLSAIPRGQPDRLQRSRSRSGRRGRGPRPRFPSD